jgi:hypothetical protein
LLPWEENRFDSIYAKAQTNENQENFQEEKGTKDTSIK